MQKITQLFFSTVCLIVVAGVFLGCTTSDQGKASADGLDRVTLMLNWYPESEHGGFYAADVLGIFEKYGIDVEIRPGGPTAPVVQELVTGRTQFALGNADDVLLFRQQGAEVVALMATLQSTPRCILVNRESGVTDMEGLSGMTLQANVGRPFLDFMKQAGLLENVQIVPYSGSLTKVVTDPKTAIQAYSFAEPLMAEEQGISVNLLMLSEIGFNPYATCLISNVEYVGENPDLVRRMAAACREGWQRYLEDPAETNKVILAANEHGMTEAALNFGAEKMRSLVIPEGSSPEQIGAMDRARWAELISQFESLDLLDAGKVSADDVFTNDFLQPTTPDLQPASPVK